MFTMKDIIRIIVGIIVFILVECAVLWLISKFIPLLIGAIVFIPWLLSALANGAKTK